MSVAYKCPNCDAVVNEDQRNFVLTSMDFSLSGTCNATVDWRCPYCKHNLHASMFGGEVMDLGD